MQRCDMDGNGTIFIDFDFLRQLANHFASHLDALHHGDFMGLACLPDTLDAILNAVDGFLATLPQARAGDAEVFPFIVG
ncbi:hypothetical protein B5E41_30355 [Rhizobium esperanzae]|uniref:Uncharacterized protein n=1 Tax=Rhizobium esperanzae TaxID=1967781 RepID=A0A246DKJ5_9HYPH|nr:hypothetical protein B5E41_30355 [Rhizobium esperanzae]